MNKEKLVKILEKDDRFFINILSDGDRSETIRVTEFYQAFKARGEAKEKLTEIFGPLPCRCPINHIVGACGTECGFLGKDGVCTHPSNKAPGSGKGMISVKDDLPPMFTDVLVRGYCGRYLLGKHQIYQARRFCHDLGEDSDWYWLNTRDEKVTDVTHWGALPSEPEAKCKKGIMDNQRYCLMEADAIVTVNKDKANTLAPKCILPCKYGAKPPEAECEHGCIDLTTNVFVSYKSLGDRHCRGCGDRLR
ncbi:hypothetical protein LCGC14_2490410 [marine sediment metagenome]|uniref:Uncharacterized protein n=1 Tax=marine sediment metagenome TaxID=412755 RepID=A0A0F9B5J8_9ZZZZ